MDASWNELLGAVLRPARPLLMQCRARAAAHEHRERRRAEHREQALAACRTRIELARAVVFSAGDGVVNGQMTALEREWRALARAERSFEERTASLWHAVAPRRWTGRLRTLEPAGDAEAALALASDPEGVERAESCGLRLAAALSAWGLDVRAAAVRWRITPEPTLDARAEALLDGPLRALTAAVAPTYGAEALVARAHRLEREVLDAATGSPVLSTRPALAADLALAARVDFTWRACVAEARRVPAGHPNAGRAFHELESPAAALLELWQTGYVLSALDGAGVTLGALPSPRE